MCVRSEILKCLRTFGTVLCKMELTVKIERFHIRQTKHKHTGNTTLDLTIVFVCKILPCAVIWTCALIYFLNSVDPVACALINGSGYRNWYSFLVIEIELFKRKNTFVIHATFHIFWISKSTHGTMRGRILLAHSVYKNQRTNKDQISVLMHLAFVEFCEDSEYVHIVSIRPSQSNIRMGYLLTLGAM